MCADVKAKPFLSSKKQPSPVTFDGSCMASRTGRTGWQVIPSERRRRKKWNLVRDINNPPPSVAAR